ncbi:MAG: hypothetical protein WC028_07405 [Candidatus Obscuribacterales bacterium]
MKKSSPEPATQALIEQIEKFESWLESTHQSVFDQKEVYPEWLQFSAAFVNFLGSKKQGNWTEIDEQAIETACHFDLGENLFCSLSELERIEPMIQPYSNVGVRMRMLSYAKRCKSIKMQVALFYFENDHSEAIREEALIALSKEQWPEAEGHALRLWKTRKTVDRMVALDCLHALNSDLLVEYLHKAAKSRDGNVRRAALAISSIKNIDKMNWPKKSESLAEVKRQAASNLVPTEEDWGDYTADDYMIDSHEHFYGKTREEMNSFFLENPMEAADELFHMPPIPFQYYIGGFEILRCPDAVAQKPPSHLDNYSDVASCFLSLIRLQLKQKPAAIMPIMKDILSLAEFTAAHQENYQASIEIYGSFAERLAEIKSLYADLLRDAK